VISSLNQESAPPNRPLERPGVNPCADVAAASAGRSAPMR